MAHFDQSSLGLTVPPVFFLAFPGTMLVLDKKKQPIKAFLTRWLKRPPQ